jgi:hypothetical protein
MFTLLLLAVETKAGLGWVLELPPIPSAGLLVVEMLTAVEQAAVMLKLLLLVLQLDLICG